MALRQQEIDKSIKFICFPPEEAANNLACYNGEYITQKGRLVIAIESGGWTLQSAPFFIVDDQMQT